MNSINDLLIKLGSYNTLLVVLSFLILLGLNDKQSMRFSGVTAAFYIIANLYFDYLLAWDAANLYRYFVWFSHDLLWMGVIAYLGLRDKVNFQQSVFGQLLCLPILCLNLLRAIDMAVGKFNFSLAPYQVIYPICESAIVVLCWVPIFVALKNKLLQRQLVA